jgi:hypothetical protein
MHFAHGWPRTLATRATGAPVALHVGGGCTALVTAQSLELWSAGRNRVRLARLDCSGDESDGDGGVHIAAAWSGARRRLAVLVRLQKGGDGGRGGCESERARGIGGSGAPWRRPRPSHPFHPSLITKT